MEPINIEPKRRLGYGRLLIVVIVCILVVVAVFLILFFTSRNRKNETPVTTQSSVTDSHTTSDSSSSNQATTKETTQEDTSQEETTQEETTEEKTTKDESTKEETTQEKTTKEETTKEETTQEKTTKEETTKERIKSPFEDMDPLDIQPEQFAEFKIYYEKKNSSKYTSLDENSSDLDSNFIISQVALNTWALNGYQFFVEDDIEKYPQEFWDVGLNLNLGDVSEAVYLFTKNLIKRPGGFISGTESYALDKEDNREVIISGETIKQMRYIYFTANGMKRIIAGNYEKLKNKTLGHFLLVFMKLLWWDFGDMLGDRSFEAKTKVAFKWDLKKKTKFYLIREQYKLSRYITTFTCYFVILELYEQFYYQGRSWIKDYFNVLIKSMKDSGDLDAMIGNIYIVYEVFRKHKNELDIKTIGNLLEKIGERLYSFDLQVKS
eukprot:GAHX01000175.1.p1 GENE.GAHX01000175.1~~GAHX01000175.1.p1  ORF type:complete len:436 (+),score=93.49 GAHX01000175.1:46-1353(+)